MNVPVTQEQDTSNNGGILSTIGGIIGLMVGGPTGAAIGSGMGSLAGGGSFTDAFRTGIMNLGIGALPGGQAYLAQNAIGQIFGAGGGGGGGQGNQMAQILGSLAGGGGGGQGNQMAQILGSLAGGGGGGQGNQMAQILGSLAGGGGAGGLSTAAQTQAQSSPEGQPTQAQAGGLGPFLTDMAKNPFVMATLFEALQPKGSMMTPLQQQQMATGERLPDYRGTAAPDFRYGGANPSMQGYAMGGFIEGPGTGTSDSIPATIYQNGGPVQKAMLSDGEFVMTADAVRGAGGGNRGAGAAKMYEMMNRLERRA
jgi:hypothetical protein